jgi:SAM-dependent methyltransferase
MKNIRHILSWRLRILAKLFLARLPIPYKFWKKIGFFEHGDMNDPKRAISQFLEHARTADILATEIAPFLKFKENFTILELGPGDSFYTAVISKSLNAEKVWLVDAGSYAKYEINSSNMSSELRAANLYDPFLGAANISLEKFLQVCNCSYLIEGVQSLVCIPNESVDYCFSNAVLEHIPKRDFHRMINELFRLLKTGGTCVHRVDLRDHLGGALNNLRFSDHIWESNLFFKSGFYTNRIRFDEMIGMFKTAGFSCKVVNVKKWDKLPTDRVFMNSYFASLPFDNLSVQVFDLVLKK